MSLCYNFRFGSILCFSIICTILAQHETICCYMHGLGGWWIIISVFMINVPIPKVRLKNGPTFIGQTSKTFDEEKLYYSFRGIPFAKPPVGPLRFRAPVPLSNDFSNKTIHAFNDGPPCINVSLSLAGSEDCLYLNVYTPQVIENNHNIFFPATSFPTQNAPLLPVMVWIYGGAYVNGDGSYATFGPDVFLNEGNVIIVTFNYRVGIFGFLSTGDKAAPGNYGLKDQVMTLKWVQQNIRPFGGNPDQVTVFGQSSGAVSISYLTQTNLTKGLFHRAILESGTSINSWALRKSTYLDAAETAFDFGIHPTNSEAMVDGLREIDYSLLHHYQSLRFTTTSLSSPANGLPYGPVIEPPLPDAIIVNKTYEQLEHGMYHQIPYIIGFNSMEATTILDEFSVPSIIVRILDTFRVPSGVRWILNMFMKPIWNMININLAPVLLRIVLFVVPGISVSSSLNVNFTNLFDVNNAIKSQYNDFYGTHLHKFISEDLFNRPILEAARLYSQRAPVYVYRFSYEGSLPSNEITLPAPGVGHGDEVLYMWRWRKSYNNNNLTAPDLLTRKRLIKLWTNFAKTGNPTPDKDPLLENVKWEVANANGNFTYLDIGRSLSAKVNYDSDQFKFWKKLFQHYGNPPYSTY